MQGETRKIEEFWGAGGNSENSPCRFCFFWRPKENLLPFALKRKNISLLRLKAKHPPVFISLPERNLTPFALKRKAFVCEPRHSVKVLVGFGGDAANEGSS